METAAVQETLVACLLYLVVLAAIGAASARFSSAGLGEFFLGGRRLSAVVVALSAVVSGRSAWLLLGFSGIAFVRGFSAVWAVVGYIAVELLLFLFFAPPFRRMTAASDALTVPDFLATRFGDAGRLLRVLSAGVILVFMTVYVSVQFISGGKALGATFPVEEGTGVAITAAVVLLYTMLGGFRAVALTDVVQAIFMVLALVVLPVVAVVEMGGLGGLLEALRATDALLLDPLAISAGACVGFLGIGLGSPGNPHILVRYMSIAEARRLPLAAAVGTVCNSVMACGALFIGLAGRARWGEAEELPGGDPESVFPALAEAHLAPFLVGLVLASVLAAIMSSADSQLLVAASAVVRDLYEKLLRRRPHSPRRLVVLSRVVILVLVAAAVVLGFAAEEQIFWLVLFAWGGLGAAFGPVLILAVFWQGATGWGAAAGLVAGTAAVMGWKLAGLDEVCYELPPAFALAFVSVVVVSRITRRRGG